MIMSLTLWSGLCVLSTLVQAKNSSDGSDGFPIDPYLRYRPEFARSMPVQLLITGVILALVCVLFIHLLFTGQYHHPLSPANYRLQLSGVISFLITLTTTIHAVLSRTINESQQWPYMLSYVAVCNRVLWTPTARVVWIVITACTSGLIQMTHIQFLTLLYPSRLEARLIASLLVPLSVTSVGMRLLLINTTENIEFIASAARNVCDATLALLFTIALFIWGLLINRKQSWRLEGGTAAFGAAALSLASVSTGLFFLFVPREEQYMWLPSLMWSVVLWQNFMGWWWWVGAGSGSMRNGQEPVEELIMREEKRERKRKARFERRKETKEKARKAWRGVTDAFIRDSQLTHRRVNRPPSSPSSEVSTPSVSRPHTPTPSSATSVQTGHARSRFIPTILYEWFTLLRHAHQAAARVQTVERAERIREMERDGVLPVPEDPLVLENFGRRIGLTSTVRARRGADAAETFELESYPRTEGMENCEWEGREARRKRKRGNAGGSIDEPWAGTRSIAWWGPLRRWRLQNQTLYS